MRMAADLARKGHARPAADRLKRLQPTLAAPTPTRTARRAPGANIKALAEYLGYSGPGFTLRTYTHLMPNSQGRARRASDAAFGVPDADTGPGGAGAQS
ncbi:hypothetical protein [Streptomyces sp. NRRL S-1022]|uniref:hypothetical protein n=1 Tax=Streptomyces sp. NRRL S-1022 TaxID=1463880 RepID=UPI00099B8CC9